MTYGEAWFEAKKRSRLLKGVFFIDDYEKIPKMTRIEASKYYGDKVKSYFQTQYPNYQSETELFQKRVDALVEEVQQKTMKTIGREIRKNQRILSEMRNEQREILCVLPRVRNH